MEVVCAILYYKKKILVAQRSLDKDHGGSWEFPGGKIQGRESHEQALSRELQEELNLKISDFSFVGTVNDQNITLHAYKSQFIPPYTPNEHRSVAWASPESLSSYSLCHNDIALLNYL